MEYLIFGSGKFWNTRKKMILSKVKVLCLIDNNKEKWGTFNDGIIISNPENIKGIHYDRILIMVGDSTSFDIKHQLESELDVDSNLIEFYEDFLLKHYSGAFEIINSNGEKKKMAIVSPINYSGGSVAAVNLAEALNDSKYECDIVCNEIAEERIQEIIERQISVIRAPCVMKPGRKEIEFLRNYEIVICNLLHSIDTAFKISKYLPTIWWVHEPSNKYCNAYDIILRKYPEYVYQAQPLNLHVFCVSKIAGENLKGEFPKLNYEQLTLGLPDNAVDNKEKKIQLPIVFTCIGSIYPLKAQLELLEALDSINVKNEQKCVMNIVGGATNFEYYQKIEKKSLKMKNVNLCGVYTQDQIKKLYSTTDVIICPSYEETMSISIVEGMMNAKTCIISKNTGIASYVQDKENGILCEPGESASIADAMLWCINNRDKLDSIGRAGRKIFDQNFTIENMRSRIISEIDSIVR